MRAEKKLYLAWREHRLMNLINHVIFETDRKGQWLFLNDAWQSITGFLVGECLGDHCLEYIHPEDRKHALSLFKRLLEKGEDAVHVELRFRCKDGSYTCCHVSARLSHADDGTVLGVAGTLSEVEAYRHQEANVDADGSELQARLQQEQGMLAAIRALFSGAPEPVAEALHHLRALAEARRAYFYANERDRDGNLIAKMVHAAVAPDVGPHKWSEWAYEASGLSRWQQELSQGHVLAGPVASLPDSEQAFCKEVDIRSLLLLPVMVGDAWYGFIGIDGADGMLEGRAGEVDALRSFANTLGVYLARHKVEQQKEVSFERRGHQVALATRLAQRIAASTPLEELYKWLLEAINEDFGYYHSRLLRYEERDDVLILAAVAGVGAEDLPAEDQVLPKSGIASEVLATGRSVLRPDVYSDPHGETEPQLTATRGELAVPIRLGNNLLGVLEVHSDAANRLDEEDQWSLEGLSSQIATAIEGERLRQELVERLEELDNLQRLMSREAWLRIRARREAGVQGYRFDREQRQVLTLDDGIAGNEAKTNGDRVAANREKPLALPLQVRGEAFGIIGIEEDPHNPLTEDERELLHAVSQQVAEAMEHARLLQQTQKRAVELETVSRVSAATSTILEGEKLLQAVVELAKRSFELYHAHIYLVDEQHNILRLAAGSGEAGAKLVQQGWHIGLGHPRSAVARAARDREGITIGDAHSSPDFLPNPFLPETRSELAVPMIAGNRLLGVFDVQSDIVNFFSEDDVRIQSALANQVAIALQNATLYQEQLGTAKKLREFDRLKSEFLASMSHELRTPLNSIIGFADVLLEGIDGVLNPRMQEDVILIRNSGQHLRMLIGDILDMSKIEAGMMELRYEEVDLPAMANEIEGFARTQLMTYDKENLEFQLEIGREVGIIRADRTRFKQIIYNLVSNAIKFTAHGSVTLKMNIKDNILVVEVADTGIGIEEEDIPIVFEQFRQVDGSLTRTAGGTGLGLPISKSLVELHGGEIRVESEVNKGTVFTFTIPTEMAGSRKGDTGILPELPQMSGMSEE